MAQLHRCFDFALFCSEVYRRDHQYSLNKGARSFGHCDAEPSDDTGCGSDMNPDGVGSSQQEIARCKELQGKENLYDRRQGVIPACGVTQLRLNERRDVQNA